MEKPIVRLTDTDGNVFAIIGNMVASMRRQGCYQQAKEFQIRSFNCSSYDEVLNLCLEYADIE